MTILPIKAVAPACYGIACDLHSRCARYGAVEASSGAPVIGTCVVEGGYAMFLELDHQPAPSMVVRQVPAPSIPPVVGVNTRSNP